MLTELLARSIHEERARQYTDPHFLAVQQHLAAAQKAKSDAKASR